MEREWMDLRLRLPFMARLREEMFQEEGRQVEKWGVQSHSPERWALITTEEFGEAMKELNEIIFRPTPEAQEAFHHEMVQTITLLAKMLEMAEAYGPFGRGRSLWESDLR